MAINEPDENGERPGNAYAKYTGLGFQMVVTVALFAYGGYKIDQSMNHHVKWVTALLSLIGVSVSLYILIVSLRKS